MWLALLLTLSGEPCEQALRVIPAIAGEGNRCWFQAETCGGPPPTWSVVPEDVFLQALTKCSRPVDHSDDQVGVCAYIAGAAGPYAVTITSGDRSKTRTVEIGEGRCATEPDPK